MRTEFAGRGLGRLLNLAFIQTSTNAIERNQSREPRGKSRLSLPKTRQVAIVRDQLERNRPAHLAWGVFWISFLDERTWCRAQFAGFKLLDSRLSHRVSTLATAIAKNPGKGIPHLFKRAYDV